jgi:hypothetical protein
MPPTGRQAWGKSQMTKASAALGAALAFCLFGRVAFAEIQLQPGLWQETETGTENDQPAKSETTTRCMTPEEAAQPSKAVVFDAELRKHCRTLDFERTGDMLAIRLECGQQALSVNIDATFTFHSPQHYSGVMKLAIRLGSIKLSTDKTIDAKRIGACPQ